MTPQMLEQIFAKPKGHIKKKKRPTEKLLEYILTKKKKIDLQTIKTFIDLGAKLDVTYEGGLGILHHCSRELPMIPAVIKLLVINGANPNQIDKKAKAPPINWCFQHREVIDESIVNAFLENGANVDMIDETGSAAIHYVCATSSPKLVRKVLAKSSNLMLEGSNRSMLAHWAARNQFHCFEVLKILAEYDLPLDSKDSDSTRPLHEACSNLKPSLDAVKFLIEEGCRVDLEDKFGETPLHDCCSNENSSAEIAAYLIKNGASVSKKNQDGNNPLHLAASNPKANIKLFGSLFDGGAKLNKPNKEGLTAIELAANHKTGIYAATYFIEKQSELDNLEATFSSIHI